MKLITGVTALFLSAAVLLLVRSSWERNQLRTEHYKIIDRRKKAGYRIAFFSDVHDRLDKKTIIKIIETVRSEKPDAVIMGGDIATYRELKHHSDTKELSYELIKGLSDICPVFYGEGNHEQRYKSDDPEGYAAYVEGCKRAGAMYMTDGHVVFGGSALYFASIEGEFYKKRFPCHNDKEPMPCDYLIKKLGLPKKDMMNILILHSPMYLREAADWGADLVLSGHFHGGTIRLPHLGGLMTPQFQFFVKECSGLHHAGGAQMVVTRGIGTHSVNIRLNDLPEISIIDIVQ